MIGIGGLIVSGLGDARRCDCRRNVDVHAKHRRDDQLKLPVLSLLLVVGCTAAHSVIVAPTSDWCERWDRAKTGVFRPIWNAIRDFF